MTYKACIFDLDGTILNTIDSIAYFGNKALTKYGFGEIETERYKEMVGNGAKVLVRKMLKDNGCDCDEINKKVLGYYKEIYDNDFLFKTTVYDGIRQLLVELKDRGIKIAVLSNKPHITTKKLIDNLFGEDYFDICYGNREGIPLKPDTTALLALISELGVTTNDCIYIGDSGTDMQTGKGGGLFTIGVLWGFRKRDELAANNADLIISHPNEILKYFE